MQTIQHTKTNLHSIFTDFDKLYAEFSVRKQEKQDGLLLHYMYDQSFLPLIDVFREHEWEGHLNIGRKKFDELAVVNKKKHIIVCFSGGKDSTATALYYKKRGYNVTLYHVKGINKTYQDEYVTAFKMASMLDLPIVIEEVKLQGTQEWIEHPMKNMIVANMALQYGIRNQLTTRIAFGNFSSSSLYDENFEVCAGDCKEMWKIYEKIIRKVIPKFSIYTPFENMKNTWDILLENKYIATIPQSCIGPYRYRDYLNKYNSAKFKIAIPQGHCGSCWKCCMEYCVYADNDIYEYNEDYYRHCLKVLQRTLKQETGKRYTLGETWQHYFFYSNSESKYSITKSC